ncbi:sodium ion-translocating decarboxylase subunit beta, partial [Klebsiella pneumoniae]
MGRGVLAFCVGPAAGGLRATRRPGVSRHTSPPRLGSAGGAAVPLAARGSPPGGLAAAGQHFLLRPAMGPPVAGVLGSAIAAGVM